MNDRLILNKKIFEDLKQLNTSISDTQIKQFENFLSKLDTPSLKHHENRMALVLHDIHKKAELSPLKKIYTTIIGQSKEEYQAKKVEKILTMEHPNYKVIDDTKSYKSSLQTPTPVQIKQEKAKLVKQALNTPIKAPPKPTRNFKTPNQIPNTSKDSSKQHER